jgi:uncharacterized membrane protein YgcG
MIISGNTGLSGVMMFGLPGNIVTDQNGYYSSKVPSGWRGRVKPVKEGYVFKPVYKNYGTINSHQNNQNYVATKITFTISGTTGISGVVMRGLPGNPITGRDGTYRATLEYGWAGTVKPKKDGCTFEPAEMRYTRVVSDMTNHNYSPKRIGPVPIFARTGSREVLVIPSTDIGAENLLAITEDLQVMSHIFDEKFKEPQKIQGVFIDFGDIFGRDSRSTEAIYMQDYGVLFLMEVNFAFSTAPEAKEQQGQETEDVDPTWQQARRKIFSPPGFGGNNLAPGEKYSAEKIDQLKTELIRTLKHTANIRNLQPDEWIILTVIGKSRQPGGMYEDYYRSTSRSGRSRSRGRSTSSSRGGYGGGGGMGMGGTYGDDEYGEMYGGSGMGGMAGGMMGGGMGGMAGGGMGGGGFGGGVMMGGGMMGGMYGGMEYGETGSASTTVLTIRVKKSDVDAFAKGDLDFERFQKKVDIFTY